MGVCTVERPVMHWQQSARIHGPIRERSPSLPNEPLIGQCLTLMNNHHSLHRSCESCPDKCDHNIKLFGTSPIFNEPFRSYEPPERTIYDHESRHHLRLNNNINNHNNNLNNNINNVVNNNNNNSNINNISNTINNNNNNNNINSNNNNNNINSNNNVNNNNNNNNNNTINNNINNNNNYLDIVSSRIDCTDIHNNSTTCFKLKSEPLAPNSPESTSDLLTVPDDCAGCGRLIQDRFYLSAVDKRWHASCLQCCVCRQPFDRETSCYSRDGNIYCKADYLSLFRVSRCSRCMASISSSELVMRARNLVFHLRCFSCETCKTVLQKGDQFGIRESQVYCRLHFEIPVEASSIEQTSISTLSCQFSQYQNSSSPNGQTSPNDNASMEIGGLTNSGFYGSQAHGIPHVLQQQPVRQKGRPRKRKPKDIAAMTANLDLNSEYLDLGYGRGPMSAAARSKRMRTSFKHHQLRTMKSYFTINHNPDAKDLKQLAQKTGLQKRVLQVWFQNARAKWRRMMMKQDGKNSGSDKGDNGSLDLDSYSHSPSFMMTGGSQSSPGQID